jgi:ribosome biogenesis GTPase
VQAALERWLGPGCTAVLVGSSGAGKSTLTNTLLGVEKMRTGEVRESDSRAPHHHPPRADRAAVRRLLIDTPGMRELKPTGEETLAEGGFADIEALTTQCRFRDCRHEAEPGCAVRAAIAAGTLDEGRFRNYLKLRDEVAGAAGRLAERQAQKLAEARVLGKTVRRGPPGGPRGRR